MTKKVLLWCLTWGCFTLSIPACSGSDGNSSSPVLESCSGSFLCIIEGDPLDTQLAKSGNRCYLGSLELRADGTSPPVDGNPTTWSGDTDKLDICSGRICFACYPNGTTTSVPSSSGTCTGSATSCSSVGASSCTDQGGCHYTIGSNISSTSDDGCAGSPRPCSDYKNDPSGCEEHRGCTWR